ncbi:sulfurtransferase TusA family protein [Actinotalea sp. C106]|uniref:sulfurtransferase TusA family protein n=1 Tax=Actinotalea sp. C106 TaxID=2908644 RepID=UPI0027DF755F|nr:sulfurtransferase TusA family protein [Actinotalea sp. C106]
MIVLDARGLRCPLPVIRLASLARDSSPGDEVLVRWTDPAAEHDIPAWARMRGHTVLETTPPRPLPDDPLPHGAGPDAPAHQASGSTLVRLGDR